MNSITSAPECPLSSTWRIFDDPALIQCAAGVDLHRQASLFFLVNFILRGSHRSATCAAGWIGIRVALRNASGQIESKKFEISIRLPNHDSARLLMLLLFVLGRRLLLRPASLIPPGYEWPISESKGPSGTFGVHLFRSCHSGRLRYFGRFWTWKNVIWLVSLLTEIHHWRDQFIESPWKPVIGGSKTYQFRRLNDLVASTGLHPAGRWGRWKRHLVPNAHKMLIS